MSTLRTGLTSFVAGEIIPNGRRVKLDSATPTANTVLLAGATDDDIGVSTMDVSSVAVGYPVPVMLRAQPGSAFICAVDAIAVNAVAYKAAIGKISASGTDVWGRALESSAADLDIIEGLVSNAAQTTPSAASVTTAKLADAVADQIFNTSVAIANTGTPDGVAHVTGQVKDAQGNALTGRFEVCVFLAATAYGAPSAQSGTSAALANSRILVADTANCLLQVLTHSDGSWGVEFTSAAGAETVHAHAAVRGQFATANAAITGN